MFAVLKTGGKQYKVSPGDVIRIERLEGQQGDTVSLSSIMMMGDDKNTKVGEPFLDKCEIKATLLEQARNRKIIVFKKRRRQGYDRKKGHRQHVSVLFINEFLDNGKSVAKTDKPVPAFKKVADVAASTEKKAAPKKAASEKPAPKAKVEKVEKAESAEKTAAPKKAAAPKKEAAPKKAAAPKTTKKSKE